jgi:hypothetical protein
LRARPGIPRPVPVGIGRHDPCEGRPWKESWLSSTPMPSILGGPFHSTTRARRFDLRRLVQTPFPLTF